jgi:hypothetical protein
MKIIESDQQARYRSSLQAAIWTRDYFVSVLKPNRSPWAFELLGMHEQMNDGRRILGVARADFTPVPYLNVYQRGNVCWPQLRLLDKSIRTEMFARTGLVRAGTAGSSLVDARCLAEFLNDRYQLLPALPSISGKQAITIL